METVNDRAVEAYLYLYPIVVMETTRLQATSLPAGKVAGRGPMNTFAHARAFPTADFRMVVRPNFDTLYSSAWLDLTDGPVVVSAPDMLGRYHMLPLLDMWTDVFAVPGSRTSGTGALDLVVVPPGWQGSLPERLEVVEAPTVHLWLIGRTQTDGPDDYADVRVLQDEMRINPLTEWTTGSPSPEPQPTAVPPGTDLRTPPLELVDGLDARTFFTLGAELLGRHRPHLSDWSVVRRLRDLGIVPSQAFEPDALKPSVRAALDEAPARARALVAAQAADATDVVNGWQMNLATMGVYGNAYLRRAMVARIGLGANPPEDAVYPMLLTDADGERVRGEHRHVLHFDADRLPPVDAFWSVTLYDRQGFQVANELDRFALGDRDPLRYGDDGSLELFVQPSPPPEEWRANWLPSPEGPINLTMRLYAPRPEVLDGTWAPPPLQRVD